jgi:hypothetical protein
MHRSRTAHRSGFIEIVTWQLPHPVPSSEHQYKYCLAYIVDGQRAVGYDNERGKGDHKHAGNVELSYTFTNIDQLMVDFLKDVEGVNP